MDKPNDDNTEDKQDNDQQEESPPPSEAQNTEHMIPKSRFNEVNDRLKAAEEKLKTDASERQAEKDAQLADDNEYEQLYKAAQEKLEPLKLEAEQAARFREALKAGNEARLARIPEDLQKRIPPFEDPILMGQWLDANADLYVDPAKPRAPKLDGGAGGMSSSDVTKLTAKEVEMAKNFGLTVEEYARGKVGDREQSEFETK